MTLRSLFLVFILSLIGYHSHASVKIVGTASYSNSDVISCFSYADHFTKELILLNTAEISEEGDFELEIEVDNIMLIELRCSRVSSIFYVEPGREYSIELALKNPNQPIPFANTAQSEVIFYELPPDDINALLTEYNRARDTYFNENYAELRRIAHPDSLQASGEKRKSKTQLYNDFLDGYKEYIMSHSPVSDKQFYKDYFQASIGSLELMGSQRRRDLHAQYIEGMELNVQNDGSCTFVEEFFEDYLSFSKTLGIQEEIVQALSAEGSYERLLEVMGKDDLLADIRLRKIVILLMTRQIWDKNIISKTRLKETMKEMSSDEDQMIASLAQHNLNQLGRCEIGFKMEAVRLPDLSNELHELPGSEARPMCIFFWASWNRESQKELAMLDVLAEEFKRDIDIYAVAMDEDRKSVEDILGKQRDASVVHLLGARSPLLQKNMEVYSIPTMYIISSEGKFLDIAPPLPSEGLHDTLTILKGKKSKGNGSRPGQREN